MYWPLQWFCLCVIALQKLLSVLDELENLKPKVRRQLDELEKGNSTAQMDQFDGPNKISYAPPLNNNGSMTMSYSNKQVFTEVLIV